VSGRLLLVRHAESEANTAGFIDHRPPGAPLTSTGRGQVEELVRRLSGHRVHAVLSSTASRTQDTAAPVAASHGCEVLTLDDLLEIDCGKLDSLDPAARKTLGATLAAWMAGRRDERMAEGESWNVIEARMLRALSSVGEPPWPGDVIVVGHAGSLHIAATALLGPSTDLAGRFLPNAGVMVLTSHGEKRWTLEQRDPAVASPFGQA
jgi:broad specificity phosphatase PhoE